MRFSFQNLKPGIEFLGQFLMLPFLSLLFFQSHILIFLAPIPLMYGFKKYGRRGGYLLSFLTLGLALVGGSPTTFLIFLLTTPLVALLFCELSELKLPMDQLILRTTVLLVIFYGAILGFVSKGQLYAFLHGHAVQYLHSLPQILDQNGASFSSFKKLNPSQFDQLKEKLVAVAQTADAISATWIQEKLFGYIVSGILLTLWLAALLLRFFRISLGREDLTKWKAPDHLIWLFIASFFFHEITVPVVTPVARNIFTILLIIYFLQGVAIAAFYFSHKNYSSFQKVLGYALL
ncbi:MAG: DUF2232 domain-containing protein, partial [Deltaproteobacteria bacterium]|nr:DUF2232 domain-containing protein [Deltaproteobacteria bacterium]